jgi:hypothetical protein
LLRKTESRVALGETIETDIRMSFDRFLVMTPRRRTSSGRRGSASLTRFATRIVAMSGSTPFSKVTVMLSAPLDEALEE